MVKIGMLIADRYEVLEKIGTGGMSVVYRAKDHKLNRLVAIKILKQEFSDNANFVSKFRVEAQAAAGLMHPNIVNVYDVGDEKGMYYIVMELVDGITLKKYIEKKSRLSVKEAISIAIQVSMGLEAAHSNHIIHRDIKPQNIIISRDGKVKVTDFGIAKAATSNTITSNVMGSVHYTSPEQARGGYSDERSDIYSLGISIFEMLTGRVPFNGETTVAIAIKHIQTPMPSPREYVPEIPRSVEQIVLKCCEKSPDRRYQNMAELIADLKQSLIHPDDDFVRVIHPDEESATRMASRDDQDEIRRHYTHRYADDYDSYPEENDEYYADEDQYGSYPYDYQEEYYEDGYDRAYDEYPDEDAYADRRRRDTSRLDEPLRKNQYTGRLYDDPDYDDDFADDGYDPKKEHIITFLSIIAAIVIGLVIVYLAASRLGFIKKPGEEPPQQDVSAVQTVNMPTVVGKDADSVRQALTSMGVIPEITYAESDEFDAGIVISSSVPEGTKIEQGSSVVLTVSTGEGGVEVPDVVGMTLAEARSMLQRKGFSVDKVEQASEDTPKDCVISQNPSAETAVPGDTTITIYISTGPSREGKAEVPELQGFSRDEAMARLIEAGLELGTVTEVESVDSSTTGLVLFQSIPAGSLVEEGSTVDVQVSKGPKQVTYSYVTQISAPSAEEDPAYVPGTQVYIVLIASDGQKLMDTTVTSFPVQVNFTGLTAPSGTIQMSYTSALAPSAATDPATGQQIVRRDVAFSVE